MVSLGSPLLPVPPLPLSRLHFGAGPEHGVPAAAPGGAGERDAVSPLARFMAHMLDEIDYGMVLVDADARVLYCNHVARRELDQDHPLQMAGKQLVTSNAADTTLLQDALAEAQRGLRRLLTLGGGDQFVAISVVPMPELDTRSGATLLVLGKRAVCEQLSVQFYARSVALTPAETRVLNLLCDGVQPTEIAAHQGVAVSTVRTQIGSIRAKTGAGSIRELVRRVAVLPPLVGALRSPAAAFGALRMPLAS
jgi:DNA-binding CsgD family transcriptional regulator